MELSYWKYSCLIPAVWELCPFHAVLTFCNRTHSTPSSSLAVLCLLTWSLAHRGEYSLPTLWAWSCPHILLLQVREIGDNSRLACVHNKKRSTPLCGSCPLHVSHTGEPRAVPIFFDSSLLPWIVSRAMFFWAPMMFKGSYSSSRYACRHDVGVTPLRHAHWLVWSCSPSLWPTENWLVIS